jgi:uncharacterized protein YkwD
MAQPTAQAQQMLELINRMRQAPAPELNILLNSGDPNINNALTYFNVDRNLLSQQWSQLSPTAPVAWSNELADAAIGHSQQMINANLQSHQVPGELPFDQRAKNAGYNFSYLGENIAAYSTSVFQGHASFGIDWGNGPGGIQLNSGHRTNIMSPNYREVGVAATPNTGNSLGALVITQEFGNRFALSGKAWLLGVAFNDTNNSQFYDAGEGLGGITVQVSNLSQPNAIPIITSTLDAGGYQTLLDPGQYQVKFFQNNTLLKSENISINPTNPVNVKSDLRLPLAPKPKAVSNDFGGDGKSDIYWRNNVDGNTAIYQMNGNIANVSVLGKSPLEWNVATTGDVGGDGTADVIWQNSINGSIAILEMANNAVKSAVVYTIPPGWKVIATGDFNPDNKADLLWQGRDGSVAISQMDGSNFARTKIISGAVSDWQIAGTGDFNKDGQSDILWQQQNTGAMAAWLVNDLNFTAVEMPNVPTGWKLQSVGDFNGDDRSDILLRNNGGDAVVWQLGATGAGAIEKVGVIPSPGVNWTIAGTGDYNGDKKADVLWHNAVANSNLIWSMDGTSLVASSLTTGNDSNWQIAAPSPININNPPPVFT